MSGFDLGLQIAAGMAAFFILGPIVMWLLCVFFLLTVSIIKEIFKSGARLLKIIFNKI